MGYLGARNGKRNVILSDFFTNSYPGFNNSYAYMNFFRVRVIALNLKEITTVNLYGRVYEISSGEKKKATSTGGHRLLRDVATRGQVEQKVKMNVIFSGNF